ncbi:hypothetical protein QBC45DRAFT_401175 [Copromyces sp. CBS 386.78]|nr:hypothetical protein QBC45DRAFT_401175 [Copromyces sp. CBS 386.78]
MMGFHRHVRHFRLCFLFIFFFMLLQSVAISKQGRHAGLKCFGDIGCCLYHWQKTKPNFFLLTSVLTSCKPSIS